MYNACHATCNIWKLVIWWWKLNQWVQSKIRQYVPEAKLFWQKYWWMERVLNLTFFIYTLHKMWSSVSGHRPIWGLLEVLPMYTFGHHRAPGQRSKPSRPRYLKGTKHMLSCMLYLLLPLNWFSLTLFTW